MKKNIGARPLIYPTPAVVVGTYDQEGKPNAMTAAWVGLCCSTPPCIMVALGRNSYTNENIQMKKFFTVNIPSQQYVKEVDYFGITSGKNTDKFEDVKLTPVASDVVDAPYVKEFPLVLECKLVDVLKIGSADQLIGEIIDVKADESVLNEAGLPDIEKVQPMLYAPAIRQYYSIGNHLGKAYSIGKEIKIADK